MVFRRIIYDFHKIILFYCCPSKIGNLATQRIFALKAAKALDSQVQKHSTSLFKHKNCENRKQSNLFELLRCIQFYLKLHLPIELFEDLLALELKKNKTKPPPISKVEVTVCKYDTYTHCRFFIGQH